LSGTPIVPSFSDANRVTAYCTLSVPRTAIRSPLVTPTPANAVASRDDRDSSPAKVRATPSGVRSAAPPGSAPAAIVGQSPGPTEDNDFTPTDVIGRGISVKAHSIGVPYLFLP
jgi:hypothetical protein